MRHVYPISDDHHCLSCSGLHQVLTFNQSTSQSLALPKLNDKQVYMATAATLVDRAVAAIAIVKAFSVQSHKEAKLAKVLDKVQASANGCLTVWGITLSLSNFAMMAMFIQGFCFGTNLVRSRTISLGDVMAVFWACLITTSNLQMCILQLIIIAKGKFSIASLLTQVELTPWFAVSRPASTLYTPLRSAKCIINLRKIVPPTCKGGIKLCDMTFAYPSRPSILVL